MKDWSLESLLSGLHKEIQTQLEMARKSLAHPGTKGDASESVWLDLLNKYLPKRYRAAKAHVVDSAGKFSDQIDVLIFDRQYSPLIFQFKGVTVVPAESVYAVFEAKQALNAAHVKYAQDKVSSVRQLHRTTLPIPHAGGTYPPKPLMPICGGVLCFSSDWKPPMGEALVDTLGKATNAGRLDFGCIAADGYFAHNKEFNTYDLYPNDKPATSFLFRLIAHLQSSATVPMIDIQAYAKWLS